MMTKSMNLRTSIVTKQSKLQMSSDKGSSINRLRLNGKKNPNTKMYN